MEPMDVCIANVPFDGSDKSKVRPALVVKIKDNYVSVNFLEDYTTSSGEPLTDSFIASLENAGPQTICKKASKNVVWAKKIPTSLKMEVYNKNGKVLISNNADVPHGNGDFIVAENTDGNKPSPTKRNLVNGVVFVKSYKKYNKEELIAQLAIEKELKELEDKEKAKSFLSDADKADIERENIEHFKKIMKIT